MKELMLTCAALTTLAVAAIDPRVPPIFTGSVMTNETVLFMGTEDAAPLMYRADEILSVTSFDLKTEYKEGVDWTFDAATRTIRPTPNTRMPYYKESEWYPAGGRFKCVRPGKPFVFFSEGSVISLHQVCVTYRHSDSWDGPVPRSDAAAFAPLLARLSKRVGGKTLFYGDSITFAYNSSGMIGFEPRIPGWPKQVHDAIVSATGNAGIEYVNTAIAGKNSQWGVANVKALVIDHAPDFVLIAFGMNDRLSAADYAAKTAAMVDAIHAALPHTAILLVPPMVPNLEVVGLADRDKLFPEYEKALCALVEKYHAAGFAQIGCANVNTMHAAVLARKRYRDMTGNNINHCNDFSARIYRDTILAAMGILPQKTAVEPVRRIVLSDESRGRIHYYDSSDPAKCFFVNAEKTTWDLQRVGTVEPGKIGRYRYVCRKGFKVVDLDERRDVDEFRHPSLAGISSVSLLPDGGFIASVNPHGTKTNPRSRSVLLRKFSKDRRLVATYTCPGIFNARTTTFLSGGEEALVSHEKGFTRVRIPREDRDMDVTEMKHFKMPHSRNMYHAVPTRDGKGYWAGAGYAAETVRFASDGKVEKVWPIAPSDGKKGYFFAEVQEFSNGHVLVANWTGHGAADSRRGWQLIEFDENGKVAWTLYDPERFGSIHGFVVLEAPGL